MPPQADAEILQYKDAVDGYVVNVREEYKARRQQKRAGALKDRSEISAVRGALIECAPCQIVPPPSQPPPPPPHAARMRACRGLLLARGSRAVCLCGASRASAATRDRRAA